MGFVLSQSVIMKILESQNAVLTNFEVYQHMLNEQHKFKQPDRKKKVPRNVQNIIKEASISSIVYIHGPQKES